MPISRRSFFQGAVMAASAAGVVGANGRMNIGIAGLGGRGTSHIEFFGSYAECRIGALCDVSQAARERAQATTICASSLRTRRSTASHCPCRTTGMRWRRCGLARRVKESFNALKSWVRTIHLKDLGATGYPYPWHEFFGLLRQAGFKGWEFCEASSSPQTERFLKTYKMLWTELNRPLCS